MDDGRDREVDARDTERDMREDVFLDYGFGIEMRGTDAGWKICEMRNDYLGFESFERRDTTDSANGPVGEAWGGFPRHESDRWENDFPTAGKNFATNRKTFPSGSIDSLENRRNCWGFRIHA